MELCEAEHPSMPLKCTKEVPCFGWHTDDDSREIWKGTPLPEKACSTKGKRGKLTLSEIANRMGKQ